MAQQIDLHKAELISEITLARARVSGDFHDAARSLNVVDHVRHSITEHKTGWLAGATLAGTVFAWLMRRPGKKRLPLPSLQSLSTPVATTAIHLPQKGWIGVLLAVFGFAFKLFKPLITAVISRKIAQMAARAGHRQL